MGEGQTDCDRERETEREREREREGETENQKQAPCTISPSPMQGLISQTARSGPELKSRVLNMENKRRVTGGVVGEGMS